MTATPSPIRIFEPDGRAVPYVDEGEGPSIVLVPGWAGRHRAAAE